MWQEAREGGREIMRHNECNSETNKQKKTKKQI
jgi:hypothetical protein